MSALQRARAFLRRSRLPTGGWPYVAGGPAQPEATVLAAAAGPEAEWLDSAWLSGNEQAWSTFLLPAVAWGRDPALCAPALDRIEAFRSSPVEGLVGFDATLPGWSWVSGTAAWIQPTAFAMLSLRRVGRSPERIEQGVAMIADRQCADGGWNYGNPEVLGAQLAAHIDSTGWALLALPPREELRPVIERGLAFMTTALTMPSTMGLALGALSHLAHGQDPSPFLGGLAERVGDEGVRSRVDLTALAAAALSATEEGWNAFL
mgnify:CR=1 FL=1